MKNRGIFIVSLLLLFSLTLVTSAPPTQLTESVTALRIEVPILEYHKLNNYYDFHIHVHNGTSGLLLTNDTTDCIFHLYNPGNGTHRLISDMGFSSNLVDFSLDIDGGNFSEVGQYAILIYCNTTNRGGYFEYPLMVTKTGDGFNVEDSLLYFILAFGVFFLFVLSFYFMLVTPYSNKANNEGAVIQVSKLKYIKLALVLLTWVLFTWFLNILIGLSDNYATLTMYYGFFGFMFDIMNYLALPLGVFVIVLAFFEIFRDANIMKEISKFGSSS